LNSSKVFAGLPHHPSKAAPRAAQRHHELPRAFPAPADRVPGERAFAVVDLRLFTRGELQPVELLGLARAQPRHEALDAYLRMALRSMPVARSGLCPDASSAWMVVCLFGFKTFNSSTSTVLGRSVHVLSKGGSDGKGTLRVPNLRGSPLFFLELRAKRNRNEAEAAWFSARQERRGTRKTARNPAWRGGTQKRQSQPRTVGFENWWPGAESNHRHADFQSCKKSFAINAQTARRFYKSPRAGCRASLGAISHS
jgi:hypothetical protein